MRRLDSHGERCTFCSVCWRRPVANQPRFDVAAALCIAAEEDRTQHF